MSSLPMQQSIFGRQSTMTSFSSQPTFGRQLTVTSFGGQSTFDTIDEEEVILTDGQKRKKQNLVRRGRMFLALGFLIVLWGAGALGVSTYYYKYPFTKIKHGRFSAVLDYTDSTDHVVLDVFEFLNYKWLHPLRMFCHDSSKPKIIDCLNRASEIIPRKIIHQTPLYIINGSYVDRLVSPFKIQNNETIATKTRLSYYWLGSNYLSDKKPISFFSLTPNELHYVVPMMKSSNETVELGGYHLHVKSIQNKYWMQGIEQFLLYQNSSWSSSTNSTQIYHPCYQSTFTKVISRNQKSSCQPNKTDFHTNFTLIGKQDYVSCSKLIYNFLHQRRTSKCDEQQISLFPKKETAHVKKVITMFDEKKLGANADIGGAFVEVFPTILYKSRNSSLPKFITKNKLALRFSWTLGFMIEKLSNAKNSKTTIMSPTDEISYKKITGAIFTPLAVLFSFILMIGLILVIIGNAHF